MKVVMVGIGGGWGTNYPGLSASCTRQFADAFACVCVSICMCMCVFVTCECIYGLIDQWICIVHL